MQIKKQWLEIFNSLTPPQEIYKKLKNVDLMYTNVKKYYDTFKSIIDHRFRVPIVKLGNRSELMYDVFHNVISVYRWLIKDDNTDKSFQRILNLKIQIHVRDSILENQRTSKITKVSRILKEGEDLITVKLNHLEKLKEIQTNFTNQFYSTGSQNKTKLQLINQLNNELENKHNLLLSIKKIFIDEVYKLINLYNDASLFTDVTDEERMLLLLGEFIQ